MVTLTLINKNKSLNLTLSRSDFIPDIVELLRSGISNKEIAQELPAFNSEIFKSQGSATSFVDSISSSLRGLTGKSREKSGFVYLYAQFLLNKQLECPSMTNSNKASAWYIDRVHEYLVSV